MRENKDFLVIATVLNRWLLLGKNKHYFEITPLSIHKN